MDVGNRPRRRAGEVVGQDFHVRINRVGRRRCAGILPGGVDVHPGDCPVFREQVGQLHVLCRIARVPIGLRRRTRNSENPTTTISVKTLFISRFPSRLGRAGRTAAGAAGNCCVKEHFSNTLRSAHFSFRRDDEDSVELPWTPGFAWCIHLLSTWMIFLSSTICERRWIERHS